MPRRARPPRDRLVALAALIIAGLVRLCPRRFRRAYGAEMVELFERRCAEVWQRDGGPEAVRLFRRSCIDLLATAFAEHRGSSFDMSNMSIDTRRAGTRGSSAQPGTSERADGAQPRQAAAGRPPESPRPTGDGLAMEFLYDLRQAARGLRRRPGFAAFVVITLALGIGANTAIFSVVNGVLLRPLPYDEPDRLIDVWGRFDPISGFDFPTFPLSAPEWIDYRAQNRTMEDVAAYWPSATTLTSGEGEPERVSTAAVSSNLFGLLGAAPSLGRMFGPEEDREDAKVALLEYGYWQSRFGGDRELIGATITLDSEPWTVLGVMPEGFRFTDARIWVPTGIDPESPGNRQSHFLRSLGRLTPDATMEQAAAEMTTLMSGWAEEYPEIHTGHYLYLSSMIEDQVGGVRPTLLLLLAAAGFVMLIVCANVASVVLARGEERVRELAIRTAMGARRWRIVRLLLGESVLLSLAGGVLGILVAVLSTRLLLDLEAGGIPRADSVAIDGPVMLFALAATLVTALLFGLFPALHSAAADPQSNLRDGGGGAGVNRGRLYFRRGLVVAQVALSFVLVLGAGLMIKSFAALLGVDPGYRTDGLLVARISLPAAAYAEPASVDGFFDELLDRTRNVAGVEATTAAANLPLDNAPGVWDFRREGLPVPADGAPAWNASFSAVRADFFEAMGVPLLRGRLFEPSDDADGMLVTVINKAMARKFFAGEDPLAQRLAICCPDEGQEASWMTVVGIVGDMRYQGFGTEARPAYYAPQQQMPRADYGTVFRSMTIVMRTGGDPMAAAPAFREIVRSLDDTLPIINLRTMEDLVSLSVARPRFSATLLSLFGAVALLFGATGIYGVLACMVAQRTHEIGIRKALGARPVTLAGMILLHGMFLVGAGVAIGVAASYWATKLVSGLLFGVAPLDPATYVEAVALFALVSVTACGLPTLRAVWISPLVAISPRLRPTGLIRTRG